MPSAFFEIDIAFISLCLFFAFFASLIFYLRREDRREGYPLEEDGSGRRRGVGSYVFIPEPKTFLLPHGQGTARSPDFSRKERTLALKRTGVAPGSPSVPTGNPLADGVGPASYASRLKTPELTSHGDPKIVPMRRAKGFTVVKGDIDPRGLAVFGADGRTQVGTVSDLWVDQSEAMIRYLEVKLGSGRTVLVPMTMATFHGWRRRVLVDAINAAQFEGVPATASPDQITLDEEERVVAYYGGGYLYASPERAEPLL